jgi:hypothetical protein
MEYENVYMYCIDADEKKGVATSASNFAETEQDFTETWWKDGEKDKKK